MTLLALWRCRNVTFVPLCGTLFRLAVAAMPGHWGRGGFQFAKIFPGGPLTVSAAFLRHQWSGFARCQADPMAGTVSATRLMSTYAACAFSDCLGHLLDMALGGVAENESSAHFESPNR